jgi:parallel beta-helix repeat protein
MERFSKFDSFLIYSKLGVTMMHHRKNLHPTWQFFLTLVLMLCMVGWNYSTAAAAGATYYVDNTNTSCSDSGTGLTPAEAFCTIGKAASIVVAGDTVQVLAGTYAETVNGPNSGLAGLPITYVATPGVTVTGGGAGGFRMSGKSYIVVNGFTITGTLDYGIYTFGSDNITLANNHVSYSGSPASGSTRAGIYINSTTNSTISGNTSDHNSSHGILLTNGSNNNLVSDNLAFGNAEEWQRNATGIRLDASNNNTILHNITYANEDTGLNIYTGSSGNFLIGNVSYGNGDHGIDFNAAPNNTVIGNTVQGNVTAGINFEGTSAPGSGGATVVNNIMVDNGLLEQIGGGTASGQAGNLRFDANSLSGDILDYNIFYSNSGASEIQWNGTNYPTLAAFQAAVPGQETHGLEADPLFIAPAPVAQRPTAAPFNVAVNVGDYHLTAGSPAIDSANSDAPDETALDMEGNARVDDPSTTDGGAGTRTYDDRGAYEFQPVPQEADHGQQGNGQHDQQGNGRHGQQGNGRHDQQGNGRHGQQGNNRGRR